MTGRRWRLLKLSLKLLAAWVVMIWTHEVGHLLGGFLSGATLIDCDLVPWHLPHSLHQPDPHPLVTLWMGPIFGVVFPFVIAGSLRRNVLWFIADFCMIANGTYLAVAWFSGDRYLDTPRLLNAGATSWSIAVYCMFTIGVGYVRFRADCVDCLSPPQAESSSRSGPSE